jgi:hypothetical protein
MPITITLPENLNKKTAASRLSSRKLLDIATDIAVTKNERDIQSAILELQQRKRYLPELAAQGLVALP